MIRGVDRGDFLIVSLERGTHVADTKEIKITDISSTGDMTVEFDEDLTLEATLYRDSQGSYQVCFNCPFSPLLRLSTFISDLILYCLFKNRRKTEI